MQRGGDSRKSSLLANEKTARQAFRGGLGVDRGEHRRVSAGGLDNGYRKGMFAPDRLERRESGFPPHRAEQRQLSWIKTRPIARRCYQRASRHLENTGVRRLQKASQS